MKLYRTKNRIINLENIKEIELQESTSQHTCKGNKYTDFHYSILISYMIEKQYTRIDLPDNDKKNAENVFETIYEIINTNTADALS